MFSHSTILCSKGMLSSSRMIWIFKGLGPELCPQRIIGLSDDMSSDGFNKTA